MWGGNVTQAGAWQMLRASSSAALASPLLPSLPLPGESQEMTSCLSIGGCEHGLAKVPQAGPCVSPHLLCLPISPRAAEPKRMMRSGRATSTMCRTTSCKVTSLHLCCLDHRSLAVFSLFWSAIPMCGNSQRWHCCTVASGKIAQVYCSRLIPALRGRINGDSVLTAEVAQGVCLSMSRRATMTGRVAQRGEPVEGAGEALSGGGEWPGTYKTTVRQVVWCYTVAIALRAALPQRRHVHLPSERYGAAWVPAISPPPVRARRASQTVLICYATALRCCLWRLWQARHQTGLLQGRRRRPGAEKECRPCPNGSPSWVLEKTATPG